MKSILPGRVAAHGVAGWVGLLLLTGPLLAGDAAVRALPAPHKSGGKPLMQALNERRSQRDFLPDALTEQQLSDLCWAAFGLNRPEIDHRTAPSAQNTQDVDLYVALADGVYVYEAKGHGLRKVSDRDVRPLATTQDPLKVAAAQVIYVSDHSRMAKVAPEARELYSGVDTGAIVQNVYLYCASEGLATVVHELDRGPLAKALELRADQHIIVAQAVGRPK